VTSVATADPITFFVSINSLMYSTGSGSTPFTINFAVNGAFTTPLNDWIGDQNALGYNPTITVAYMNTSGTTNSYCSGIKIDGQANNQNGYSITTKWQSGLAPTVGSGGGAIDVYTFTIIKNSDKIFTVLASFTKFS
jgi:hypothetical protein